MPQVYKKDNAVQETTNQPSQAERQLGVSIERVERKYAQFDKKELQADPPQEQPVEHPYKQVDYKKRYDDLKRHYDTKVNEWKREKETLEKATQPKYTPPKTREELEVFKNSNPDLYGVVETIAHDLADARVKTLEEELNFVRLEKAVKVKEKAEVELRRMHPDIDQLRASDQFHNWVKEQPQQVQDWLYKNTSDAVLAAKAINLYKAENKHPQQEPPRRVTTSTPAADAVRTRSSVDVDATSPKIWTTSEIAAMNVSDYAKHQQEIMIAMKEGRILKR